MNLTRPQDRTLPHYVYVCYDADDWILYIGASKDPAARVRRHSRYPWAADIRHVQVIGPLPCDDAFDLEAALIHRLAPIRNWEHNFERKSLATDLNAEAAAERMKVDA